MDDTSGYATKNKIIHYKIINNNTNREQFLDFIKAINDKIYSKKYLLLDNARIHHYKKLKDFIIQQNNIDFIYNIPYTPEFNPIKYIFN